MAVPRNTSTHTDGTDTTKDLNRRLEATKKLDKENRKNAETLAALQWKLAKEGQEDLNRLRREDEEKNHQLRLEMYREEGNKLGEILEQTIDSPNFKQKATDFATGAISSATSTLTSELDEVISSYISKQQSMTAHLVGNGRTLSDITDNLNNALSTSALVKQEAVYSKLYDLVNQGIVYNVEQRAFLQTLADDINLSFGADGTLNRLIRLQQIDLTSNRVAIAYSLQEFLNKNYETSEYIIDAFSNVSNALLESQSWMSASSGIALESTLQTWLGSLYSSGASSEMVNNLASAFNALGSGDISNLGNGISNLVLMGVARAGLDYGSLLTGGISSENVNSIMSGVLSYLTEMGDNNNVVRSQLASLFGVSVSDIKAASQLNFEGGSVGSDIRQMLNGYSSLVPLTTQMSNVLSNFMYSWGTNIASNPFELMTYKTTELISDALGDVLDGVSVSAKLFGSGVDVNIGDLVKAAPLIGMLPGFIQTIGDVFSNGWTNPGDAYGIFTQLAGESLKTLRISNQGVSGSAYISSNDVGSSSNSLLNNSMSSISDLVDTETIKGDDVSLEENVSTITENVVEIYNILSQYMVSINNSVEDLRNEISLSGSYTSFNSR